MGFDVVGQVPTHGVTRTAFIEVEYQERAIFDRRGCRGWGEATQALSQKKEQQIIQCPHLPVRALPLPSLRLRCGPPPRRCCCKSSGFALCLCLGGLGRCLRFCSRHRVPSVREDVSLKGRPLVAVCSADVFTRVLRPQPEVRKYLQQLRALSGGFRRFGAVCGGPCFRRFGAVWCVVSGGLVRFGAFPA